MNIYFNNSWLSSNPNHIFCCPLSYQNT